MKIVIRNNLLAHVRGVIFIGRRSIVNQSRNNRYIIYLPTELNDLWEFLNKEKKKVKVYIEIE